MMARMGKNKVSLTFNLLIPFLALILVPAWAYAADTNPYFNVARGGLSVGGGFYANPNTPCKPKPPPSGDADYQTPDFSSSPNLNASAKTGGILAYGNSGAADIAHSGAHSDLAAQAQGLIESGGPNLDFFSGPNLASHSLNFANDQTGASAAYTGANSVNSSGLFSGGSGTAYCIYDYFGKFSSGISAANTSTATSLPASLAADNYLYNPSSGQLSTGSFTVSTGSNVTIFVNGDLHVNGGIHYSGGPDTYSQGTDTKATKLAFVVKGNIYIDPTVTTASSPLGIGIFGLYIAQPKSFSPSDLSSTGFIYTCNDGTRIPGANPPDSVWIQGNCENPSGALTVNGALIAQNIVLDRVIGDIGSGTPAESFTFSKEMVLGGPFFAGNTTTTATVDSLVSLPPVF